MNKKVFLSALLAQLGEVNGKKSLQKLAYLARAFGLETGYSFRFHYYGPFSDDLASDFESLLETRQVKLVDNSSYKYKVSNQFIQNAIENQTLEANEQEKIYKLISTFGNKAPSDLELYATIYFIDYNEKVVFGNNPAEEDILKKTSEVKTKYTMQKIRQAYEDLKEWDLLYKLPEKEFC